MQPCKTNYWGHRMASSWTPERIARQAELIRTWKPWQQATGPRTPEGKAVAAMNAYKGGHWLMIRELSRLVNAEIKMGRDMVNGPRPNR
jgi:hypothetical protein